jgi:hypothetical protein
MLQFDKSLSTNTNAVWISTVNTSSGYYDTLRVVCSQSYDLSTGSFDVTTTSSPNAFRNWLIIRNNGLQVPSPSGQYDIEIFRTDIASSPFWDTTTDVWSTSDQKWATFGDGGIIGDPIYTDRAYISGSNETTITQYLSPNETGKYITYNG